MPTPSLSPLFCHHPAFPPQSLWWRRPCLKCPSFVVSTPHFGRLAEYTACVAMAIPISRVLSRSSHSDVLGIPVHQLPKLISRLHPLPKTDVSDPRTMALQGPDYGGNHISGLSGRVCSLMRPDLWSRRHRLHPAEVPWTHAFRQATAVVRLSARPPRPATSDSDPSPVAFWWFFVLLGVRVD